jgi:heme o synthase
MEIAAGRKVNTLNDYVSLLKLRVVLLHLVTATVAVFLAGNGLPSAQVLLAVCLGGGLVTAASNTLNCYFDRGIDRLMARTANRPLASGRVSPGSALWLTAGCCLSGLFLFIAFSNLLAAALAMSGLAYYLLYTLVLKRNTSLSTIIGSGAGAFPPLTGWAAVTGSLGPTSFMLAAIIMLWTAPHFWTLAAIKQDEYRRAGINILPPGNPVFWIQGGSLLLIAASLYLIPLAGMGALYAVSACLLGSVLVFRAVEIRGLKAVSLRRTYFYSMIYLALLFAAMAADRVIAIVAGI